MKLFWLIYSIFAWEQCDGKIDMHGLKGVCCVRRIGHFGTHKTFSGKAFL